MAALWAVTTRTLMDYGDPVAVARTLRAQVNEARARAEAARRETKQLVRDSVQVIRESRAKLSSDEAQGPAGVTGR